MTLLDSDNWCRGFVTYIGLWLLYLALAQHVGVWKTKLLKHLPFRPENEEKFVGRAIHSIVVQRATEVSISAWFQYISCMKFSWSYLFLFFQSTTLGMRRRDIIELRASKELFDRIINRIVHQFTIKTNCKSDVMKFCILYYMNLNFKFIMLLVTSVFENFYDYHPRTTLEKPLEESQFWSLSWALRNLCSSKFFVIYRNCKIYGRLRKKCTHFLHSVVRKRMQCLFRHSNPH